MPGFISFEDLPTGQAKVASAAWQLMLDHSDCPTSGNIVELGYIASTTSKTTITNGMRQFWRLLSESINTSMHIPNIPIELEQAIFGVYKDLNARAETLLLEKSSDYKKSIDNYEHNLEDASHEIVALKHDLKLRQTANEQLICDAEAHSSIISRLNTEVREVRHERSQLETALKDGRIANEQLEKRLTNEQTRNDKNLEKERERFDLNDTTLKKRIDELNSEIKSIRSLATVKESKFEKQLNAGISKTENLNEELQTKIKNELDLMSQLKESKSLLFTKSSELTTSNNANKTLDKTASKHIRQIEDLRIIVAEKTEKNKLLELTSTALQGNNESLLKQLEALTSIIKDDARKESSAKGKRTSD